MTKLEKATQYHLSNKIVILQGNSKILDESETEEFNFASGESPLCLKAMLSQEQLM